MSIVRKNYKKFSLQPLLTSLFGRSSYIDQEPIEVQAVCINTHDQRKTSSYNFTCKSLFEDTRWCIKTMAAPKKAALCLESAAHVTALRPALVKYFARKCANRAEAEDLAQDVIERALAKGRWTSIDHAKGYVFRIAVNRWHDRNRRGVSHGVNVEWDDAASFAQAEDSSPERVLGSEQELYAVVAALQELNERTRDVFMLDRLEHLKHVDIARLFGISVSAVEKHVAKALAHIARCRSRGS